MDLIRRENSSAFFVPHSTTKHEFFLQVLYLDLPAEVWNTVQQSDFFQANNYYDYVTTCNRKCGR